MEHPLQIQNKKLLFYMTQMNHTVESILLLIITNDPFTAGTINRCRYKITSPDCRSALYRHFLVGQASSHPF